MSIVKKTKKKKTVARVATGVTVGLTAFGLVLAGSSAANAANDPGTGGAGPNTVGNHVAVGSDTLQDLYGAFAGTSSYGLDSFTAFASTTITLAGSGGSNYAIARPAGSGDGVEALSATYNSSSNKYNSSIHNPTTDYFIPQTNKVIDIARSSSRPSSTFAVGSFSAANLAYVPLARDAVSVAVKNLPSVTNLTTLQLKAIFGDTGNYDLAPSGVSDGDVQLVGSGTSATSQLRVSGAWVTVDPKLPQASSGTRSFFLTALGLSAKGAWVEDGFNENDASVLTGTAQLIPFSAGQWISQWNNVVTRTFDPSTTDVALIDINSLDPYDTTGGFPGTAAPDTSASSLYGSPSTVPSGGAGAFNRDVYSVVVKTTFGTGSSPVIPGSGLGKLVATDLPADSRVGTYGFRALSYSGTGAGWQYATWTNP